MFLFQYEQNNSFFPIRLLLSNITQQGEPKKLTFKRIKQKS